MKILVFIQEKYGETLTDCLIEIVEYIKDSNIDIVEYIKDSNIDIDIDIELHQRINIKNNMYKNIHIILQKLDTIKLRIIIIYIDKLNISTII